MFFTVMNVSLILSTRSCGSTEQRLTYSDGDHSHYADDTLNPLHPSSAIFYDCLKKELQGRDKVEVRKSTLENAGYGLFSKVDFKKGDTVCTYEGLVTKKYRTMKKDQMYGVYCAEVGVPSTRIGITNKFTQYMIINAVKESSCYGRWINDPMEESFCNVKILYDEYEHVGIVKATDDISRKEEFFLHYSDGFWTNGNKAKPTLCKKK